MLSAFPQQLLSARRVLSPCPSFKASGPRLRGLKHLLSSQLKPSLLKVFPSGVLSHEEQRTGLTDPHARRKMAVPSNFTINRLTSIITCNV